MLSSLLFYEHFKPCGNAYAKLLYLKVRIKLFVCHSELCFKMTTWNQSSKGLIGSLWWIMKDFNHSSCFCVCIFCHSLCLLQGNDVHLNMLNNSGVCRECLSQTFSNRTLSTRLRSGTHQQRIRSAFGAKHPFISSEILPHTRTGSECCPTFQVCLWNCLLRCAASLRVHPSQSQRLPGASPAPQSPSVSVIMMTECAKCPKVQPGPDFCFSSVPTQHKRWLEYQALNLLISFPVQTLYTLERFQSKGLPP